MNTCPTHDELLQLLKEQLPRGPQERILTHLDRCRPCQAALEALAGGESSWDTTSISLKRDAKGADRNLTRLLERLRRGQHEFDATLAAEGTPVFNPDPIERTGLAAASDDPPDLSFLQPATKPGTLGRLGHYEVHELLGQGGFGIVVRAFDEKLQRMVAIKLLAPHLAATSPARKRFLREAQSSARIRHENVVWIHAIEEETPPYLVMEYIPGETLQQRLNDVGPMSVGETLRLGAQIARGLAAAHAVGVVHRDIKPANILLEHGVGRIKLTDFGLARAADDASHSQSGVIAGTPMYMAPEQAEGHVPDHRGDLFSLGSVLYVMCSGRPPFRAASTLAVLQRVVQDTPRPIREIIPETPQWLCDIIARLQAKKPDDRYGSAQEVAELLECALVEWEAKGTAASPPAPAPGIVVAGSRPSFGRRGWLTLAAAALFLAVLGFGWTEATGVTTVWQSTVIRLFHPEGTLVVEVDDPAVTVRIDGEELIIAGAGPKEIRVKPGQHKVEANKDGKVVRQELITIARGGREVVRLSREPVRPEPKKLAFSERRAAEYVLSVGGSVRVDDLPGDIRIVADLPAEPFRLTKVNLYQNKNASDEGLAVFKGCVTLKALDLGETAISDAGLAHFADCGNLTELSLYLLKQISDAGLSHFKGCKGLQQLNLNGVFQVTDAGISQFGGCKNLTELALTSTSMTDAALASFRECKSLTRLILQGDHVTDAGLAAFQNCQALTHLLLITPAVTNAGLAHFGRCTNLESLRLCFNNEVTDAGLTPFAECKSLTDLELTCSKVTDAGLALFKERKGLTRLVLLGAAITDKSVAVLSGFPELTSLVVTKTQMKEESVKKIAAALPRCRIEHDGEVIEPQKP